MGHSLSANVHISASEIDGSKVRSRSIYRRPESDCWSAEALAGIKATPWSEREKPNPEVVFWEHPEIEGSAPSVTAAPLPRAFQIMMKDVQKHGRTAGCPQCDHFERYGKI